MIYQTKTIFFPDESIDSLAPVEPTTMNWGDSGTLAHRSAFFYGPLFSSGFNLGIARSVLLCDATAGCSGSDAGQAV